VIEPGSRLVFEVYALDHDTVNEYADSLHEQFPDCSIVILDANRIKLCAVRPPRADALPSGGVPL
jgi:hypothetical protein